MIVQVSWLIAKKSLCWNLSNHLQSFNSIHTLWIWLCNHHDCAVVTDSIWGSLFNPWESQVEHIIPRQQNVKCCVHRLSFLRDTFAIRNHVHDTRKPFSGLVSPWLRGNAALGIGIIEVRSQGNSQRVSERAPLPPPSQPGTAEAEILVPRSYFPETWLWSLSLLPSVPGSCGSMLLCLIFWVEGSFMCGRKAGVLCLGKLGLPSVCVFTSGGSAGYTGAGVSFLLHLALVWGCSLCLYFVT